MNNGIIVWCGDSWTKGVELPAHQMKSHSFAGLISQRLGMRHVNFARPGSSIGHLVYDVGKIIEIKKRTQLPVYAMLGLTIYSRLCLEDENGKTQTVGPNTYDTNSYVEWAHNILTESFLLKQSCLSLSWIDQQLESAGIPHAYYNILSSFYDFQKSKFSKYLNKDKWLINPYWNTYGHLFDLSKFDINKISVLQKTGFGKQRMSEVFMPNMHPNKHGHQMIADALLPDTKKLAKYC
jgi:hypothetical protein